MELVELTEAFLAKAAGWEVVKQARSLLEGGQVLSSNWTAPVLRGVVQEGSTSYRAGLAIKSTVDIENICSCRTSRQWGTICAHSVAIGLHHLRRVRLADAPLAPDPKSPLGQALSKTPAASSKPARAPRRLQRAASGAGPSLELHIIVPPNFQAAASKGKVMLCFEGQWGKGRAPLNGVPVDVPFQLSSEDARVLDAIEAVAEGESAGMLVIGTGQLGPLLIALAGHPRITLGRSQPFEVLSEPAAIPLRASLLPTGEIRLELTGSVPPFIRAGDGMWVQTADTLRPLGVPPKLAELTEKPIVLGRAEVPSFLNQDWPLLENVPGFSADFRPADFSFEPQPPAFTLHLEGGLAHLQARLQCRYGERTYALDGAAHPGVPVWLPDPNDPRRYATRDAGAERRAVERLMRSGFTGPDSEGRYQLLGQSRVLNFFARDFQKLEKEWTVTVEERLERSTSKNMERIEPRFQITASGEQWFDLDVSFNGASGERFAPAEIQRLLLSGQSYTRRPDGRFLILDTGAVEELQQVLLDCSPQQSEGKYRISSVQAGYLDAALRQEETWTVQAPPQWRRRALALSGEAKLEVPPLGALESILRPYQKTGVGWLWFLRENNFGGILADEMGLGKTLQALAFLQTVRAAEGSSAARAPWLIVCPTSLVFNWVAEAARFTPDLKVLPLHGSDRHEQFRRVPESDLVVTSYALIRRDAEVYRQIEFDTVILDEAQHIKNRQTQNAQAVKAIRAAHRLVLTGTPLENSVLDLWSIFDFLMPGYLSEAKEFRERYEIPIVRDRDEEIQKRLTRRVRPFLLRRMKKEVARDLPEKIEQISFCELTEDQRAVYREVLEASRREVFDSVGTQGLGKSRMMILNALLRLRQICCDLRLLNLSGVERAASSGKLDLFEELLEEVLDGGHRVLVFSQFVSMLTLLRAHLDERQIRYSYLDGSTSDRGKVVREFQSDAAVPVFLISLKAGGVGLNLSAADTVVHFDPWWNPAVEDQATDRAHRIGQTRVVTSYKLITRGTVEEKILNLQARKRGMLQGVLGEEQLSGSLNWDEIQELLAGED